MRRKGKLLSPKELELMLVRDMSQDQLRRLWNEYVMQYYQAELKKREMPTEISLSLDVNEQAKYVAWWKIELLERKSQLAGGPNGSTQDGKGDEQVEALMAKIANPDWKKLEKERSGSKH